MSPIYTKRGDSGTTDLADGKRVAKNSPRLEICGTLDELSSFLGLVRAENPPREMDSLLMEIQKDLMTIGGELAFSKIRVSQIIPERILSLEQEIDLREAVLPRLCSFVLPTGTRSAAGLHVARTVCRRAERLLVGLQPEMSTASMALPLMYLNRLSDLLFVLARMENLRANHPEEFF